MPKVNPVTRKQWERLYDPMHSAFQRLFQWHMRDATTPEEVQARITMDLAITVVNLFIVNSPRMNPSELREECLTLIENMRRAIEADDLTAYCLIQQPDGIQPATMQDYSK